MAIAAVRGGGTEVLWRALDDVGDAAGFGPGHDGYYCDALDKDPADIAARLRKYQETLTE